MSIESQTEIKISALCVEVAALEQRVRDAEHRALYAAGAGRPLGRYLASPYAHVDVSVRSQRYYYAVQGLGRLYKLEPRLYHFSPIVLGHPVEQLYPELRDIAWYNLDLTVLKCCSGLTVLKIDGWEESRGVLREIEVATELGIPIEEMMP